MECGDVVCSEKHEHKMTLASIDGNKAFCQYFIGEELHEETYNLGDLKKA